MKFMEPLIEWLKNNPNSSKASISEGTGMVGLILFNALKKLQKSGDVIVTGEGADATYSYSENAAGKENTSTENIIVSSTEGEGQENKSGENTDATNNTVVKEGIVEPPVVEKTKAVKSGSRNNDKYKFDGAEYGKGKLVLAVVTKYVSEHPSIKYAELQQVFPTTLMKRFGVFETVEKARQLSGARDRYFFQAENVIKLGDKKSIVCCTQWTAALLEPFLKVAKDLGYKIK